MPVTYNSSETGHDFGVNTVQTATFTIGAGTDRVAVIGLVGVGTDISIETAACSGVSATKVPGTDLFAFTFNVMQFVVINPPSGAGKFATASWTTAATASVGVIVFDGADQTTGVNNGTSTSSPTDTSHAIAITSTDGDLSCTMYAGGGSDGLATSSQTKRTADYGALDHSTSTAGTTKTHTWSHAAAEDMIICGCNVMQKVVAVDAGMGRDVPMTQRAG